MKTRMLAFVVIVTLVGYSSHVTMTFLEEKKRSEALEKTIDDFDQEVERYKVRLNDSVMVNAARVEALNMTVGNIKRRYDALLRENSIKANDVGGIVSAETVVHEVREVPVYVDSFGGMKVGCHDDYVTIDVGIDSMRKATIDYSIRDSLTVINYQKRHKLLFGLIRWKENVRTVVISHNPKATVGGVTSISRLE